MDHSMNFSMSMDAVFKTSPRHLTSMRIEHANPRSIIFTRKRYHSLQATKAVSIQSVSQLVTKNWTLLKGFLSKKTIGMTFIVSLVCPLVMPWIVALLLRLGNLGLPQVRKQMIKRSKAAKKLLRDIKSEERFYFLYGSHATGKSTLIRAALAHRRVGSIYVLVEEGLEVTLEKLALKIYMATNCLFLINFNLLSWMAKAAGFGFPPRFDELFRVGGLLHRIADHYMTMFRDNIILVVDGANSLPREVMQHFVGMAKNLADTSPLIVVLVGTGGQLPFVCSETSALTRGSFLIIPQISEKSLVKYIRHFHKDITNEAVELLLKLAGGKICSIKWCISQLKNGVSLEGLESMYENTFTFNSFALAGLLDLENQSWVHLLFKEMKAKGGALHVSVFLDIVPRAEIWRLNGGSVFCIDERKLVRFECRANEEYAWKWLARRESSLKRSRKKAEKKSCSLVPTKLDESISSV